MKRKVRSSQKFKQALRKYQEQTELPRHLLAVKLNTYPSLLSFILNDTILFYPGDKRILKIAKAIGFKDECLEAVTNK